MDKARLPIWADEELGYRGQTWPKHGVVAAPSHVVCSALEVQLDYEEKRTYILQLPTRLSREQRWPPVPEIECGPIRWLDESLMTAVT